MRSARKLARLCAFVAVALGITPELAAAQSLPRAKPLPPKPPAAALAAAPLAAASASASKWQLLTNQPPVLFPVACGVTSPVLLTDGTVLVADGGCSDWWKLTPDAFGSYVNGTWTQIASTPAGYAPLYHATAVLRDGRVIIEGGEYNHADISPIPVWTNQGAIYDPRSDSWTTVNPPAGWTTIGDAQGIVLPNGTFMLANCCTTQQALFDPEDLTWTATGSGKFDINDEEGWTLLPNGNVLTVDAYVFPYVPAGTNSEIYLTASGTWQSAGSTRVQLWDSWNLCGQLSLEPNAGPTFEVGPAMLRPDGTVFYAGSNTCPGASGSTAIYDSHRGRWRAGPNFPGVLSVSDGPAGLEPNGKVLLMASPGYAAPASFFEWDGEDLKPIGAAPNAANVPAYAGNFLVLPTGQILYTDFTVVAVFNANGEYRSEWAPVIESAPASVRQGGSYPISGLRFNGMSQGASYGDDAQTATNFPIVRITNNATGHVFFSRTHHFSSMGVANPQPVSARFDVPRAQETGPSELVVITNGIPSAPVAVFVDARDE